MGAKELFDAGNLSGAIDQLTREVRSNPRDLRSRIFLFELLCFAADYQRAEQQLDAVAQTSGDVKVEMESARIYRSLAPGRKGASLVLYGSSRLPKFFSEPPTYAAFHAEAVTHLRENRFDELEESLAKSDDLLKPAKGGKDGAPFEDFEQREHGDDLLGPFLEVFCQGEYFWLPRTN